MGIGVVNDRDTGGAANAWLEIMAGMTINMGRTFFIKSSFLKKLA
jgi:hypothetical protein